VKDWGGQGNMHIPSEFAGRDGKLNMSMNNDVQFHSSRGE